MSKVSCSVVVASWRPGTLIDRCLTSLLAQQGADDLQIIVVDSSADGTAERLQQHFPTIEVIARSERTPPSFARRLGVEHARGEFIAITDHDCVVPPDWIARLVKRHRSGDYAVVGGAVGNGTPHSMVGTASYLMEFNEFLPHGLPREVAMVPYCNACFRRTVFSTVGPFVDFSYSAEDQLFNFLIRRHGLRILFDPTIVVHHINRTQYSFYLRHQHWLGFGSAIARRVIPLKGQVLVRHPWLALLLPAVRCGRTAARLFTQSVPLLFLYLLHLPLLLPGYLTWTAGFRAGLRHELPADATWRNALTVSSLEGQHRCPSLNGTPLDKRGA